MWDSETWKELSGALFPQYLRLMGYLHHGIVPNVYMIPAFSAKGDIYPVVGGIYALSGSCGSFLGGEVVYARWF